MPSALELQWLVFGAAAGSLIYLSGVGAGVMVVPVMVTLFDMPVATAVGSASLFSVVCKMTAGLSHIQQRNVSAQLLRAFLPASVTSCLALAFSITIVLPQLWPHGLAQADFSLKLLVVLAGVFAVLSIYQPAVQQQLMTLRLRAAALITGGLVGATGAGGGVLVVPALIAQGSETTQRVIGTSLIIGLVLSSVTALFYGAAGSLHWPTAVWMTGGSLLAMPLARWMFSRVSGEVLTHLAAALIALALVVLAVGTVRAAIR